MRHWKHLLILKLLWLLSLPAGPVDASEPQRPNIVVVLVPLLQGGEQPIHKQPIYWEHEGNAAVRDGKWKLVREYEKPWELYDIEADRTEMNDLANSQPAKRDELVALWETWATAHQVAYPERFNMYQWLNQKKQKEGKKSEPTKSQEQPNPKAEQ